MRQLRAFAWLRWRLLLNGVRGSTRRDTLEQISRVLALVAPAAIVVFSLGSVIALGVGAVTGGLVLAKGGPASEVVVLVCRAVLAAQLLIVTFMPLGVSTQSGSKYARLLLLPISRRILHFVEVHSGIADPWIFVIVPALLLMAVALVAGGGVTAGVFMLVGALALLAVLLSLSALVSFLAAWLMRDRRRAEWSTLVFVAVISVVGLLPHVFVGDAARDERAARVDGRKAEGFSIERVESVLPAWTRALPSEMYGQALAAATVGRAPAQAVAWIGGLWVQAAILYLLSGLVHQQLLDAGDGQSRRRGRQPLAWLPRVPLLGLEASAVAAAQYRTGMKSVRGRLAVLLPGPMLGLLAVVVARTPDEADWIAQIPNYGHLVFGASLIFAVYAMQPFTMNQFASDRAGLTLQWLLPISARNLVWGKAAGTFGLFGTAALLALIVTLVTTGGGPVFLWLAVALAGCATFFTLAPIAAAISALFPVAADLSKTGSGGNPHGAAMLAGSILVIIAAAPPGLILLIGPRFSDAATLAVSAGWLGLVLVITMPLLTLASTLVTKRRENLYLTK